MQLDGEFNEYNSSLYEADQFSRIVFSPNVGTLCIGGIAKNQSVYKTALYLLWAIIIENLINQKNESGL